MSLFQIPNMVEIIKEALEFSFPFVKWFAKFTLGLFIIKFEIEYFLRKDMRKINWVNKIKL